jgi:tetratricopeptide (TPR) repeat protein
MRKPVMVGLYVWLMMCGVVPGQVQSTGPDAEGCRSSFVAAEGLSKSEDPDALASAVSRYDEALRCIGPAPTHRRAKALMRVARLRLVLNLYDQALDNLNQALSTLQQLGNQDSQVRADEAIVFGNLAYARKILGVFDPAISDFKRALDLFREVGDKHRGAFTLEQLGLIYTLRGETENALTSYAEALALRQQVEPGDLENAQQIAAIF